MKITPALITSLSNPEPRIVGYATEALVRVGQPAVGDIRKTLQNPDVFVRLNAVSILGRLGPQAQEAVPDLVNCMSDPHPLVRDSAVFALGQMGPAADSAGAALLIAYNQANGLTKETLGDTLKKIGIAPPLPKSSKKRS